MYIYMYTYIFTVCMSLYMYMYTRLIASEQWHPWHESPFWD